MNHICDPWFSWDIGNLQKKVKSIVSAVRENNQCEDTNAFQIFAHFLIRKSVSLVSTTEEPSVTAAENQETPDNRKQSTGESCLHSGVKPRTNVLNGLPVVVMQRYRLKYESIRHQDQVNWHVPVNRDVLNQASQKDSFTLRLFVKTRNIFRSLSQHWEFIMMPTVRDISVLGWRRNKGWVGACWRICDHCRSAGQGPSSSSLQWNCNLLCLVCMHAKCRRAGSVDETATKGLRLGKAKKVSFIPAHQLAMTK